MSRRYCPAQNSEFLAETWELQGLRYSQVCTKSPVLPCQTKSHLERVYAATARVRNDSLCGRQAQDYQWQHYCRCSGGKCPCQHQESGTSMHIHGQKTTLSIKGKCDKRAHARRSQKRTCLMVWNRRFGNRILSSWLVYDSNFRVFQEHCSFSMASCLIHGLFHEFCKAFKILLSIFNFTLKFSTTLRSFGWPFYCYFGVCWGS